MQREIERKFLVNEKINSFLRDCQHKIEINQGYLSKDPERIVRIRHISESYTGNTPFVCGVITIKTKKKDDKEPGVNEFEYRIPPYDALVLLANCHQPTIQKTRHIFVINENKWEVDVFYGHKDGLVLAEIELARADESIILPDWIAEEVTGQPEYSNSNM